MNLSTPDALLLVARSSGRKYYVCNYNHHVSLCPLRLVESTEPMYHMSPLSSIFDSWTKQIGAYLGMVGHADLRSVLLLPFLLSFDVLSLVHR